MTQPAKERRGSRRSHPTPASGDKQSSSDAGDGYERGGTLASSGRTAVASAGRQLEISGTDPFFAMGILVDKLNLLNYEKSFCRAKTPHRKPLTRTFFAEDAIKTPMASGQFDFFFHLAVWLLQQAGSQLQVPKDSSPLERCTAVVQAARALGFAAPNFPAAKLAQGHGIEVIGLLESMVDVVLEKRGFKFAKPVHPTDAMVEDAEVDDEADMTRADPADVADEVGDAGDEDEDVFVAGAAPAAAQAKEHWEEEREIIEATIDPEAWRIEMERVAPRLRIVVGADQMRDWRARLETMHSHLQQIGRAFPDLENLKALSKDVSGVLEKLSSREKMLNERFDVQCEEYSTSRSNLQSIQASFQKQVDVFGDQSNELAQINEQMAELQQLAQDHGNKVSDATPVVRVKNAIKQLNTELRALELRIGIVTSNLLHVRNSQAPSDAAAEAF